jgi:hypothetical protein
MQTYKKFNFGPFIFKIEYGFLPIDTEGKSDIVIEVSTSIKARNKQIELIRRDDIVPYYIGSDQLNEVITDAVNFNFNFVDMQLEAKAIIKELYASI